MEKEIFCFKIKKIFRIHNKKNDILDFKGTLKIIAIIF